MTIGILIALGLLGIGDLQESADDLHVVVVSIDGLRPEFYLSEEFSAPTLKSFVERGAHANAVESVYPSVTYPSHATIVTGVRPYKHGIYDNTKFGTSRWYGEFGDLRSRTLWQAARERGRTVAIVAWPTSLGADVNWIVPENHDWALVKKHSTPGLLAEILGDGPLKNFPSSSELDALIAQGAAHVLKKHKPDLLFTHLSQLDSIQHSKGCAAAGLKAGIRRIDSHVAALREAAKEANIEDRTIFLIVGDHGFADYGSEVAPNLLLVQAALIAVDESGGIRSWKALAHGNSGSLTVVAKDADAEKQARRALEAGAIRDGKRLYSVLDRARLDELGYNPDAAMA